MTNRIKNCAILFASTNTFSSASFVNEKVLKFDSLYDISKKRRDSKWRQKDIKNSIDDDLGQLIDLNSLMRVE